MNTFSRTAQPAPIPPQSEGPKPQLSVVMPCLNEADTIAVCIGKALQAFKENGIDGEVVIADNGSTDNSVQIAESLGARVVHVQAKGYGNALMGGINHARSEFVLMGDCDDSYNFLELGKFYKKLTAGADLVQGCRLPGGGGTVLPGAMPTSHRWIGNPMFTFLAKLWFGSKINDVYCGMRGFRKDLFHRLDQRCTGMEFATEMIIKATLFKAKIEEVPITLHPDGRKSHPPHLKTFRDGWRTLRFYLLFTPKWLFIFPGTLLIAIGILGCSLALPGISISGVTFDAHTLLFASLAILCGCQALFFATFAKAFAMSEGFHPPDPTSKALINFFSLERGLIISSVVLAVGLSLLLWAVLTWKATGFGHLDYAHTMRIVIPGATLTSLGVQGMLSSFLLSILTIARK